jgi:hypothetical protein
MFTTIAYRGSRINITCYNEKEEVEVQLYYKEHLHSTRKVNSVRTAKQAVSRHLKEVHNAV